MASGRKQERKASEFGWDRDGGDKLTMWPTGSWMGRRHPGGHVRRGGDETVDIKGSQGSDGRGCGLRYEGRVIDATFLKVSDDLLYLFSVSVTHATA